MIAASILLALASTEAPTRFYEPLPTAAPVDAYLQEVLRDYDTAKIERVRAPYRDIWTVRCGLLQRGCKKGSYPAEMHCYRVNAKNGYGAYTGWVYYWFVVVDGKVMQTGDDRASVEQHCGVDIGRRPY